MLSTVRSIPRIPTIRIGRISLVAGGHRMFTQDALSRDIPTVELAYERFDPPRAQPKGEPIVFLHGLFGSKINNRTVSKVFARDLSRSVYCLDLRNHGDSPHIARHDYPALAADVERFLDDHKIASSIVVGHSMGAKTAMAMAMRRPDLIHSLVPVDNAPIDARLSSSFGKYVQGMKKIQQAGVKQSKEAYKIMNDYEENVGIQQFLLANLKKDPADGVFKFRIPLDILGKSLDHLSDFPYHPNESRFVKPTLFIRGTQSHYVSDEAFPAIGQFFPNFSVKDIDCGHWVISEKPKEFVTFFEEFMEKNEEDVE